jgi:hypothetical protein
MPRPIIVAYAPDATARPAALPSPERRSSADGSVQALDAARAKTDGAASPRTDGATTPRRSSFWGFGK